MADICRVLDLHAGMTKQRLDQKGVSLIDTPTNGGIQQLVYISEKNLYKVIMRSDKPQAEFAFSSKKRIYIRLTNTKF